MKQNIQNGTYITVRIHNLQTQTEAHKTHNHTYSDKKQNQNNMKECDKRNSHTSSKPHVISISSHNGRRPVTETDALLLRQTLCY